MSEIDKIERVLDIPLPRNRVWDAVATAEGLSQWFSDRAQIDMQVGGNMQLEWDDYETVPGIVEKIEPPHEFAFRWQAYGVRSESALTPKNSTLITFKLETTDDGTRLTLIESGFASLPSHLHGVSRPEHEGGWRTELQELIEYLTG